MAKDNSAATTQLKADIATQEAALAGFVTAKDWSNVKKTSDLLKEMNRDLAFLTRAAIFVLADFTAIAPTKEAQLLALVNGKINSWLASQPRTYSLEKTGPWMYAKITNPEAYTGIIISVEKIKDA